MLISAPTTLDFARAFHFSSEMIFHSINSLTMQPNNNINNNIVVVKKQASLILSLRSFTTPINFVKLSEMVETHTKYIEESLSYGRE